MKKHFWSLLLVVILSYWSVKPLFSSGYFSMHDDTQVGRVVLMGRALREGQFPVRWVADLGYGYGYPLFNFYGPLPYYLGGGLAALGVDPVFATKIMMGTGMLLAAITMYALTGAVMGQTAGILAAMLYQYAPYHAVQLYVRGAVGELWATAFLPLVLLGFILTSEKASRRKGVIIGALGLAAIILSHTVLGFVTTLLVVFGLVFFWLWKWLSGRLNLSLIPFDKLRAGTYHLLLILLALGLSAFFWLPAIAEMRFTNVAGQVGGGADWRDHFVCLSQLWNSAWGFGGSSTGCVDGMSLKLGKLHILLATAGFLTWLMTKKQKHTAAIASSVALNVGAIALMTTISSPVWQFVPFFSYIQYPWRFLTFALLGLSFLGGTVVVYLRHFCWVLASLLILATLMINVKLFTPQFTYIRPSQTFTSPEELRWRVSKVSDEYLPPNLVKPADPSGIVRATIPKQPDLSVAVERETAIAGTYRVVTAKEVIVAINRAFFPGWQFFLDGLRITPTVVEGLPQITVPKGEHIIVMRFRNTPARSLGNFMSVASLCSLIFWYGKRKKTNA